MTTKALLLGAALAALSTSALAQTHDHAGMANHQHHGAAPAAAPARAGQANADVLVRVNGLVCDFCARTLEKTFMRTKKVQGVDVDLDAKLIRLSFRRGQTLDDASIRKLVKNAGYAVVGVERRAGA